MSTGTPAIKQVNNGDCLFDGDFVDVIGLAVVDFSLGSAHDREVIIDEGGGATGDFPDTYDYPVGW